LKDFIGGCPVKISLFRSKSRGESEFDSDIAIIIHDLTKDLKRKVPDIIADLEIEYLQPHSTIIFCEFGKDSKFLYDKILDYLKLEKYI
jgi:hypothetical protein